MRILVTGGSGFIGREVVRQLLAEGITVRVYDAVACPVEGIEKCYIKSVLDPIALCEAAWGCDAIIHLAAMVGVNRTEIRRLECMSVNIQGTYNALQAAVAARVRRFLFLSSSEVYGDVAQDKITETSPLNPKSNYAVSKLAGEEFTRGFHREFGVDFSIVRFFNVYGPHQLSGFVVPSFIERVFRGEAPIIFGDGTQLRAFCYVEDAARGAIQTLLSSQSSGEVLNIGNDQEPISVRQLADKVLSMFPHNGLVPEFRSLEGTCRGVDREIYKRLPDISKAKNLISYRPQISLDEGLRRLWNHISSRKDRGETLVKDNFAEEHVAERNGLFMASQP